MMAAQSGACKARKAIGGGTAQRKGAQDTKIAKLTYRKLAVPWSSVYEPPQARLASD